MWKLCCDKKKSTQIMAKQCGALDPLQQSHNRAGFWGLTREQLKAVNEQLSVDLVPGWGHENDHMLALSL